MLYSFMLLSVVVANLNSSLRYINPILSQERDGYPCLCSFDEPEPGIPGGPPVFRQHHSHSHHHDKSSHNHGASASPYELLLINLPY